MFQSVFMIYPQALTRRQRRKTQKNYCIFCGLNGISYMCLGETIIVLFAIKLNAPNSMVAALGAMIYFSFFMLPIGKIVAAKVGAARSQAVFWTLRNIVAIGVGLSAVTEYYGYHTLALAQVLLGACLFYGLRAAGVVMSQPFIGDMATTRERPQLIGISNALFYGGCMAALLVIWYVLSLRESIWVITMIIGFGACMGVTSTRYIRRMDESSAMIEAARRPILNDIRASWQLPVVRKLLMAMFTSYLALIMLGSVSMLSLKRGYGVSDTAALFFSLMQFTASGIFSFTSGRIVARIGSNKALYIGFGSLLAVGILWLVAPEKLNYFYAVIIFFLVGAANVICGNSLLNYYLQNTPQKLWVATSMLTSVVTSVGAGVAGMLLSSLIFKIVESKEGDFTALGRFRLYFLITLLLIGVFSYFIWKLPESQKTLEK